MEVRGIEEDTVAADTVDDELLLDM